MKTTSKLFTKKCNVNVRVTYLRLSVKLSKVTLIVNFTLKMMRVLSTVMQNSDNKGLNTIDVTILYTLP